MKWSESVWENIDNIFQSILQLPFVCELSEGTLSRERFEHYICQDAIYLNNYSRVLAHISSRLPSKKDSEDFMRFSIDGIKTENALHRYYLGDSTSFNAPSPTCLLYMSFETAKGIGPVEIEAAAILPCFWVYQRVGEEILKRCTADNPYRKWIETYADDFFVTSTYRAIEICDNLAEKTTPAIRNLMTEAFVYATKMEWMFWDSAYNLEQWKIRDITV